MDKPLEASAALSPYALTVLLVFGIGYLLKQLSEIYQGLARVRGAITMPKPKHLAAITTEKRAGDLMRAIEGYAAHAITLYARRLPQERNDNILVDRSSAAGGCSIAIVAVRSGSIGQTIMGFSDLFTGDPLRFLVGR